MQIYSFIAHPNGQLAKKTLWTKLHLDLPLLAGLLTLIGVGLIILYSAGNESLTLLIQQITRMGLALSVMILFAQIPPNYYRHWAPWLFIIAVTLLIFVLLKGHTGKGAQRWINLGMIRFQPSEIMKISMPIMLAWYLKDQPFPPSLRSIMMASILMGVPFILTAKQPDLGTALLIAASGISVIFLTGIRWRFILGVAASVLACLPIVWHTLHSYQKQRILTFINPERDPLGAGYHIIQSKIAIGSGGLFGKGWLNGSQSHLQFLPEHSTDFIFSVCSEEFGLVGALTLLTIYLCIVARGLYISSQAQDSFTRLLAGSLSLTFFISVFVNIGMVTGILPVVGIPLPLISYGGTSMVTTMACFGIIMSIHTHRKLVST